MRVLGFTGLCEKDPWAPPGFREGAPPDPWGIRRAGTLRNEVWASGHIHPEERDPRAEFTSTLLVSLSTYGLSAFGSECPMLGRTLSWPHPAPHSMYQGTVFLDKPRPSPAELWVPTRTAAAPR